MTVDDILARRVAGKPPPRGQAALAELWPPHGERPSWRHVAGRSWLHSVFKIALHSCISEKFL